MSVLIETSLGNVVVDLYVDKCPQTCLNFLKLCKIKYYNYNLFHSVQPGFMAQTGTGDPIGSGQHSSSIFGITSNDQSNRFFAHEFHPTLKHNRRGLVSMVAIPADKCKKDQNGVPLANASQFFFTLGDDLDYLDGKYTIFGEVAEGMNVLDEIEGIYCDDSGRPMRDIRINHTIILDDPFDDPTGLQIPDKSPDIPKEVLESTRLAIDESIDDDEDGLAPEEREKVMKKKEAQAQSTTLEILGDLPFANIKPPENVLFVCKLNAVTRDEDLELIFSRFGKINSCEIIRDKETGASLNYAFIEFDEKESCEEAYFKMQNVVIDDRRIHVDFSQSVSKLHSSWLKNRFSNGREELGGQGLYKKQKYRMQDAESTSKNYDLVFDNEKEQPKDASRRRSRSKSPQDYRDSRKQRSDHGNRRYRSRSRSREYYKRNQERRRSRSRDRGYRRY